MTLEEALRANPFTPVFGKVPPFMAGCESIIDAVVSAFESSGNSPDLCSIFVGARGTGKTALLTYLSNEAERLGWVTANVTAEDGMLEDVLQRCRESAAHLLPAPSKRRLTGIDLAPLGGASWEYLDGEPSNWRTRMNALLDALAERDTGLLITVDEVNPNLDEMIRLVTAYQHFVREGRNVALLMAGLPHRVSALLSGASTSFLRRAARHNLGPVPSYEVEESLRLTVESGGRDIENNALSEAVDAIDGFPFMMQLVGYRSWNAAGTNNTIGVDAVKRGVGLARKELADRIFEATMAELSKGDVAFLRAMAKDDGPTLRGDLTKRLNRSSSYVSTYKKRLLEAGLIEEPERGILRFALPGFRTYLRERS